MIWDMTLDTLFYLSTSVCNTIPLAYYGRNPLVHQSNHTNTTAKSL